MPGRLLKVLSLGVFGSLIAALAATPGPAQEPIPLVPPQNVPVPRLNPPDPEPQPLPLPVPGQPVQPAQPAQGDGIEVLAKGPVHEAFAATAEPPAASPIVPKQPPDPVEEMPPDQKPEGDNVQWIPGYWHWDEEAERFIWVSGFWRQPPPGRVWVPGSWRQVQGGFQWVGGFWQPVNPPPQANPNLAQVQPEIQYLPEPPLSLESGPTVPAPGASYFYVPGSWVWRGRYVWRPGVWVAHRPDWVWVPARFYWTPAGYVYSEGYWDYPLARRGVLFAPVAFVRPVYARPAFVYTPAYVVSEPCMVGALFVRRGYGHYYFGDYFDGAYATRGYSAWCGVYTRNGFSVGFGVGRTWGYDPLWSYYSVTYRGTPAWHRGVGELYHGRYRGELVRPPATLVQQNTTINRITNVNVTNVTNNITVVNGAPTVNNKNVSNVAMVAPLKVAPDLQRAKYQPVSAETRRSEAAAARQIREVAVQRTRLEANVAKQPAAAPHAPGQRPAPVQPKSIKLDVPKAAVTRAHVRDEKLAPPPAPHHAGPGPKVDPSRPMNPQPKFDPKAAPRIDPRQPGGPQPKFDPRAPGGRPAPKGEPHRPAPKEQPKHPLAAAPPAAPRAPKVVQQPTTHLPQHGPAVPPVSAHRPVVVTPPAAPQAAKAGQPPVPRVHQPPHVATPPVPPHHAQPPAPKVAHQPQSHAQPRPAVTLPASQPPRAVQPPKARPPAHEQRAKPAPPGKPPAKERRGRHGE
jgi:hypothetical protein